MGVCSFCWLQLNTFTVGIVRARGPTLTAPCYNATPQYCQHHLDTWTVFEGSTAPHDQLYHGQDLKGRWPSLCQTLHAFIIVTFKWESCCCKHQDRSLLQNQKPASNSHCFMLSQMPCNCTLRNLYPHTLSDPQPDRMTTTPYTTEQSIYIARGTAMHGRCQLSKRATIMGWPPFRHSKPSLRH